MSNIIWEDKNFFIEKHENPLPWVKLFTKVKYKELTELPYDLKMQMYSNIEIIEQTLIDYYNPDKINIASFGNMLPHMHWHIIARFKNDPYFPKTTWEEPVRDYNLKLPNFEIFVKELQKNLNASLL